MPSKPEVYAKKTFFKRLEKVNDRYNEDIGMTIKNIPFAALYNMKTSELNEMMYILKEISKVKERQKDLMISKGDTEKAIKYPFGSGKKR